MSRIFLCLVLLGRVVADSATCDGEDGACAAGVPLQGRALMQSGSYVASFLKTSPQEGVKTPELENYVTKELLPQAESTRQALQAEVDSLQKDVDKCGDIMHNHSVDIQTETTNIELAEAKHHECDVAQQKKVDDKANKCGEWKDLIANMQVLPSLDLVKTKDSQAAAALLLKHYEFITSFYPKVTEAQEGCKIATEIFDKHQGTCDSEMATLSAAICALKSKLSGECGDYDKCWHEKTALLKADVEKVAKLEEHNKNEFKYRTCFGIEKCDEATVDVSRLTITYPKTPAEATCIQGVHTQFTYPNLDCAAAVVTTTADAAEAAEVTTETTTAAAAEAADASAETTAAPQETTTAAPEEATTAAAEEETTTAAAEEETTTAAPAAEETTTAAPAADDSTTVASGSLLAGLVR